MTAKKSTYTYAGPGPRTVTVALPSGRTVTVRMGEAVELLPSEVDAVCSLPGWKGKTK